MGAYLLYSSGQVSTTNLDFNVTCYGLDGTFYFGPGLFAGVRAGLSSVTVASGNTSVSTNPFSVGPKFGYDYLLPAGVSLGVEGNAMFLMSSENDGLTNNAFQLLNILATIKYWF